MFIIAIEGLKVPNNTFAFVHRNHDSDETLDKFEKEDENHDGQVTWDEYFYSKFGLKQNDVEFIRKQMTSENSKSDSSEEENFIKV